jgi:hypothetical protein
MPVEEDLRHPRSGTAALPHHESGCEGEVTDDEP